MKAIPWIIAGVGIGLATYMVLNQPGLQYATGNDDIEDAAGETTLWGSKQRLSGTGKGLVGKLKEGVGRATGNDDLAIRGTAQQVVGRVQETVGEAAQVAGDTIHELNR